MTDKEKFFYNHGYKQAERDFIKELEKIKAEIEEIQLLRDNIYDNKTEYSVSMTELRELFNKHISELKGENNGETTK